MIFQLLPLLLLLAPSPTNSAYSNETCGSTLENIWLDVILLIDNSASMTDNYIQSTTQSITQLFGKPTRIGTKHTDPRSVRLGVISYDVNATLVADLDQYQSNEDAKNGIQKLMNHKRTSVKDSILARALRLAELTFKAGRANNTRTNFPKVVIIYAATVTGDGVLYPNTEAKRLKDQGVEIMVVSFSQEDKVLREFKEIASQDQVMLSESLPLQNSLLQANCFCGNLGWYNQYPTKTFKYGTCLHVSNEPDSWAVAKYGCQREDRQAYLATEWTKDKHRLVRKIFQDRTKQVDSATYFIGLNYVNGAWYWEQPANQKMLKLTDTNSPSDYFWSPNFPKAPTTNPGVVNMIGSDDKIGWQNINSFDFYSHYMCEMPACDTDHYCTHNLDWW